MDGRLVLRSRRSHDLAARASAVVCALLLITGCQPPSQAIDRASGTDDRPSVTSGRPSASAGGPSASVGRPSASVGRPSASATTAATTHRLRITKIEQPGLFDGSDPITLRTVIAAGSGFVVLGDVGTADHLATQAWLSRDGMTWERTPTIDTLDHAAINATAEMASGRLLAVGWNRDGDEVWTSDDAGRTWQARPVDAASAKAGSVAAGPAGAVLLDEVPIEHGPDQRSRLWFSADGATWEATAMPDDVFGAIHINAVVSSGNGFVAVGGRAPTSPAPAGDPLHGERAAAWWSPDGRTWSAATVSDRPPIGSAVAGADGLIGFGFGEPITNLQVWVSRDGAAWMPLPVIDHLEGAFVAYHGVISWFRSTFVRSGVSDLAVQTSRDGAIWTEAIRSGPVDRAGSGLGPIVAGEPGWLQRGSGRDRRPALWLMTVEP